MSSKYKIILPGLFVATFLIASSLVSCNLLSKKTNFELWPDTSIAEIYENGDTKLIRGYNLSNNDSSIHYEWIYYRTGKLWMEGLIKNGERDGEWKAYNENGILISIGNYYNGFDDGLKTVYYDNGTKYYEGEMKNDERVGKWQFFDKNGEVIKVIDYSKENNN